MCERVVGKAIDARATGDGQRQMRSWLGVCKAWATKLVGGDGDFQFQRRAALARFDS